jgi:hypothetical protein
MLCDTKSEGRDSRGLRPRTIGRIRLIAGMAELADAADSKSADRKVVGVRPPLPAPNKIKGLYANRPLQNERPICVGGCSDGCSDLAQWLFISAMVCNESQRVTFPDTQSVAEVESESRPRLRAPLRGYKALTPTPEPRQIISTSGECHQRFKGLPRSGRKPSSK